MNKWKKNEELYLKENCAIKTDKEIAKYLKKSLIAIRRKRQSLGITKERGRGITEISKIDQSKFYK